jgi:signal transduction histidine kinase
VLARVKSLVRVKRQRDALNQAYLDLKSLESLRDSLTMMLVHDLRTPLTTILGPMEMLQTGQFGGLEDVQREIIAMSLRSGYRLLGMVNELLDVSKMESGEMTLHRSSVDVRRVVQRTGGKDQYQRHVTHPVRVRR